MDTLKVNSPYDDSFIEEIDLLTKKDIEPYFEEAYQYHLDRDRWLKPYQRIHVLEKFITLLEAHKEELIFTAAREGGKPVVDTRIELERAITTVISAIENIPRLSGQEVPMNLSPSSEHRMAYTFKEPIGVVFAISAFNHPINMVMHQIIPAFAANCPVIVKPASSTPLSCLQLVKLLLEAGAPKEMVQAIVCKAEVAEELVSDPRISYLSFIGSNKVGWYLRTKLAPGSQCALEHGGSAPIIIAEDADIDAVLPLINKSSFYHAGQVCVSTQRIYVPQKMMKPFGKKLSELAMALTVGEPLDEKTDVGPLISAYELQRMNDLVRQAVDNGAKLLCGGEPVGERCFAPTILQDPSLDSKVSLEEIFGPIVCLYSYKDRLDAIKQANQLPFVFHASVMTQNIDIALDSVKRLNATNVMVNDATAFRVDWMPFGGRKHSGLGVGGIPYAMQELCYDKMMVIKSDAL